MKIPTQAQVINRVALLSLLLSASLSAVGFTGAAVDGASSSLRGAAQAALAAQASEPQLTLPSGKSVSRSAYLVEKDPAALEVFVPFFEASKAQHVANPEATGKEGRHYRDVLKVRARAKVNAKSPVHLLTDYELAAVVGYTEEDYYLTNGYLWRDKFEDAKNETALLTEAKTLALHSALVKLEMFKGAVLRGEGLDPKNAKEWEQIESRFKAFPEAGGTFVFKGFMSTTRGAGEDARRSYLDNAKVHYMIESKTGRLIEDVSTKPKEEEVLFSPRTEFEVTKKEVVKVEPTETYPYDHRFVIHLREK